MTTQAMTFENPEGVNLKSINPGKKKLQQIVGFEEAYVIIR